MAEIVMRASWGLLMPGDVSELWLTRALRYQMGRLERVPPKATGARDPDEPEWTHGTSADPVAIARAAKARAAKERDGQ